MTNGGWTCSQCGEHFRCTACQLRRPANSDADRREVEMELSARRGAATSQAHRSPSRWDAPFFIGSMVVVGLHVAAAFWFAAALVVELMRDEGSVALLTAVGVTLYAGGALWAAQRWARNERPDLVLVVTIPASAALVLALMAATWSRAGPY